MSAQDRRGSPGEGGIVHLARRMPIVPAEGGAGRSLTAVIAILGFLAALVAGMAEIGATSAASWRASLAREATIQIRPLGGRDIEADLVRVTDIAREAPGIVAVRPVSKAEGERLLEPWLGMVLDFSDLPVPRLIVLSLDPDRRPDLAGLGARLKAAVPTATLDTHAVWLARLSRVANVGVAMAVALVVLVLVATGGATAFATRGTLAGHRDVVEVLHFVGADDGFIARLFARRFTRLGLTGGLVGAAAAAALLTVLGRLSEAVRDSPAGEEIQALFGAVPIGWRSYAAMGVVAFLVGAVAGLVAASAVKRFLKAAYGE
ncbi:cell division protein FtsX [uncultured Enterovirga sp.]|uniref:cell division protein FtsX n=1 Tax=uncultured Enterovirga sp. TaxID=2026352 RepID=UPI0035CA4BFE